MEYVSIRLTDCAESATLCQFSVFSAKREWPANNTTQISVGWSCVVAVSVPFILWFRRLDGTVWVGGWTV